MLLDPVFYLAAVPAVIFAGLAKGGFAGLGLLATPLLTLVVSPLRAAAIMLPILIAQDMVSVWAYRRSWDGRNLAILAPSSALGILLGWLLAAKVSDAAVTLTVGVIATVFAARRLVIERAAHPPKAGRADLPRGIFWGTVLGFTSMIAHAGAPPYQIYVMPQRLPPGVFVGTGALLFALTNLMKVPPYFDLGQFSRDNLLASAVLLPLAVLATWTGVLIVRRVPAQRFYTLVYSLLIIVGAKLIYHGATALLA